MSAAAEKATESSVVNHIRRPFKGSCHCGAIQYIAYLTVPYPGPGEGIERLYKCNCRICHKAGFMHIRVPDAPKDFLLLSPLDPFKELGDYLCIRKRLHFFFCKTCGVRCFIVMGEGRISDVEVDTDLLNVSLEKLSIADDGNQTNKKTVQAWHMVPDSEAVDMPYGQYLSVNGHTIDAGQEGFDMREWVEKKSVLYYDFLQDDNSAPGRYEAPHIGGCY